MAARKPKKDDGPEPLVLHIDGDEYALTAVHDIDGQKLQLPDYGYLDKLDFREQHEVRKIARDLSGNDQGEPSDFAPMDVAPALIAVVMKRKNPAFTLDEALAYDWSKATTRPTEAGTA